MSGVTLIKPPITTGARGFCTSAPVTRGSRRDAGVHAPNQLHVLVPRICDAAAEQNDISLGIALSALSP